MQATQKFSYDFLGSFTIMADEEGVTIHYKSLVHETEEVRRYTEFAPNPKEACFALHGWRQLGYRTLLISFVLLIILLPRFPTAMPAVVLLALAGFVMVGMGLRKKRWVTFYDPDGDNLFTLEVPRWTLVADYIAERITTAHAKTQAAATADAG